MGVAACVPRQDCQVSFSPPLITVPTGEASQDGELLREAPAAPGEGRPLPLVNLAQFLDKKEQCTAWFQPCCSQYMPTEVTTQLDAAEQPMATMTMATKEMTAQEGEVYELSEDISEELKLMGMEVWLQAALLREEDCKCTKTASEARSYSASRQPEEEPGANEEAECKATSSSPCPLDDVVETTDVLEVEEAAPPADAPAADPDDGSALPEAIGEAVTEEETAAAADPTADDAAAVGDYPRLFHISALDLGDDAADEPNGAATDRSVLEGLHVATASSTSGPAGHAEARPTPRKAAKVKRRTRAEVMLW